MDSPIDGDLSRLDKEVIISLLSLLNTPRDLALVACVCRAWREYVIEGELWKRMCIKLYPELGNKFTCFSEGGCSAEDAQRAPHGYNHNQYIQSSTYCFLLQRLLRPPLQRTCIAEPLDASSTDNLPRESVAQTLYPEPEYSEDVHSYWSSKGEESASVPEMLTYRLASNLCVVYDVRLQPFLASFQPGSPMYSSKAVRFRFGYARFPKPPWSGLFQCLKGSSNKATAEDYVWTYESPVYPMAKENTLQTFRLPKPTLCIGGTFQVEFQGRVQTQSIDRLYYICVSHVYVTGRPILNFKFESVDSNGVVLLRRLSEKFIPRGTQARLSLAAALEKNDGLSIVEHLRLNRSDLRNGSVVDMLFLYLLDAKLLNEVEED